MTTQEEINRARRDRELERTGGLRLTGAFIAPVVGVTFVDTYPGNILSLREAYERPPMPEFYPNMQGDIAQMMLEQDWQRAVDDHFNWSGPEKLPAVLRRNPDNQFDSNAIEIHVPALGDEGMIGHFARPIAARLAPELDQDVRWLAQVWDIRISPHNPDQPGIDIKCARVAQEE